MVNDVHIHICMGDGGKPEDLVPRMEAAGIDGGILFSAMDWLNKDDKVYSPKERLDILFKWVEGKSNIVPFYWIDPVDKDAAGQAQMALEYGVKGFKVICCNHYPWDKRAMKVYKIIADAGKPILFHSGILYNAGPSGWYNKPVEFEPLFYVEGLRFALAHISWPWCDELISVFGKYKYGHRKEQLGVEMFVDICPGTPRIYREEVLTKLLTIGFDFEDSMLFGTDCISNYRTEHAKGIIDRDNKIYDKLGVSMEAKEKIFGTNYYKFLGFKPQ